MAIVDNLKVYLDHWYHPNITTFPKLAPSAPRRTAKEIGPVGMIQIHDGLHHEHYGSWLCPKTGYTLLLLCTVNIYIYIYIYTYTYIHIYIYTYIHINTYKYTILFWHDLINFVMWNLIAGNLVLADPWGDQHLQVYLGPATCSLTNRSLPVGLLQLWCKHSHFMKLGFHRTLSLMYSRGDFEPSRWLRIFQDGLRLDPWHCFCKWQIISWMFSLSKL